MSTLTHGAAPRARGVSNVFNARNARDSRHPADCHRSFAAWLDTAMRTALPAPGTFVTLARRSRGRQSTFRGVTMASYSHGFLVRGPHHRAFVAYRDLYCGEGHVRILEPAWLAVAVDRINQKARSRLPGRATMPSPVLWKPPAPTELRERVASGHRLFALVPDSAGR